MTALVDYLTPSAQTILNAPIAFPPTLIPHYTALTIKNAPHGRRADGEKITQCGFGRKNPDALVAGFR
jgi:hypothetical protein